MNKLKVHTCKTWMKNNRIRASVWKTHVLFWSLKYTTMVFFQTGKVLCQERLAKQNRPMGMTFFPSPYLYGKVTCMALFPSPYLYGKVYLAKKIWQRKFARANEELYHRLHDKGRGKMFCQDFLGRLFHSWCEIISVPSDRQRFVKLAKKFCPSEERRFKSSAPPYQSLAAEIWV